MRGRWVGFAVVAFGCGLAPSASADPIEQGAKDASPSGLRAGVARVDITPPVGIPHLNWGSQTHVETTGVDAPGMRATALVLSDGGQTFALVDIDRGSPGGLQEAITLAAEQTGIPAEHIRLGATHTHAGPAFQKAKGPVGVDPARYEAMMSAYQRKVVDQIVAAVKAAQAALRPVHAHGARGTGTININRRIRAVGEKPPAVGRNPDGFVDRDLLVVRIDDAQGKPYAVLINYACHGTVLTFENKLASPDWIGRLRGTVEDAMPGATALFFQGAAGNQGPMEGGTGDVTVAHRLGTILGHQAAALAWQIETVDREPQFEGFVESTAYAARQPWRVRGPRDGTLGFARKIVGVPRRRYGAADLGRMKKQVDAASRGIEEARRTGEEWRRTQAEARHRRLADLLAQWQRPFNPEPIEVELQVLRVGGVAMVAMPGEPFAEIGAAVKKGSPFPVTMFAGYSSGKGGDYMPVRSEYRHAGYEVDRTPYGEGAADLVIREAGALLRQLAALKTRAKPDR